MKSTEPGAESGLLCPGSIASSYTDVVVVPQYSADVAAVSSGSLGVATCDSSTCQRPMPKTSDGTTLAAVLILCSAFSASVQAFLAKVLGSRLGIHWSITSLSINLLSLPVLTTMSTRKTRSTSTMPQHYARSWLWCRALLGGVALNAAVLAVTSIPLASANTIMFSMPIWASLITALLDHEPPAKAQCARLLLGFIGTVIVCYDDTSGHRTTSLSSSKKHIALGYSAAFCFALFNAAACVVTSRRLRTASPAAVCAAQAMVACVIASIAVTVNAPQALASLRVLLHNRYTMILLLLEVISFPLSMLLRTAALLTTSNAHIVGLLYAEIPLVLLWNQLFLHHRSTVPQLFGVVLIILGVLIANFQGGQVSTSGLRAVLRRTLAFFRNLIFTASRQKSAKSPNHNRSASNGRNSPISFHSGGNHCDPLISASPSSSPSSVV